MIKYIDNKIRSEIKEKKDKIESHPAIYEARRKCILKDLKTIGDVYSYWVENPELRKAYFQENKSPETIKKQARKGIQNVHNAWNYLNNPKLISNFIYKIPETDFDIFKSTNALILGDPAAKSVGFRKHRVTLNCYSYEPPEKEEEIRYKLQEISNNSLEMFSEDPIESAIMWHLMGGAIQPFGDGNKRTFRLIQDKILFDQCIPPVVIPAGEGTYYHKLFCNFLNSYGSNNLEYQKDFYNYCASKINNGLDDILNDLEIPNPCRKN